MSDLREKAEEYYGKRVVSIYIGVLQLAVVIVIVGWTLRELLQKA